MFVRLHDEGLVYRGDYLVNWDPENQTVISNEEVDNVERPGHLWTVRYPVVDAGGAETGEHVDIATTRPETIPADTAVAVHPDDPRFTDLVGKSVRVPAVDRIVPVIADDYIKMDFGAGALKVTPGHDENDYAIGQRHGLETVSLMNLDGTLNEEGGPYAGLDRFEARKRIVADLEAAGQLVKTEDYPHTVPISSRSKAVIEPLLSPQWYVSMKPLAEKALACRRRRDGPVPPRPVGERVPPVARRHPRLADLPPALVGPPDPGVVPRGRRTANATKRTSSSPWTRPALRGTSRTRTSSTRGSRRGCGRSPRLAGPATPRRCGRSTRGACSSRATTSCFSGSPG